VKFDCRAVTFTLESRIEAHFDYRVVILGWL